MMMAMMIVLIRLELKAVVVTNSHTLHPANLALSPSPGNRAFGSGALNQILERLVDRVLLSPSK